ncbi:hypothetical protein TSUD_246300 [Trifolium subterraneum]|uniref:Reverse transcriptase zinc-binding domain-containing protein n=1 Tax=Trifolium subterraneum TaxID=3900 RepID=A0A2Z6NIX2_TRISU|nr:hypothetical protein TSUD_246300 [Trifolium subterraneum]
MELEDFFRWEEELVEVCSGVVLGVEREVENRAGVEVEWVREVWNPIIPAKMSILVWHLFQDRHPTKDNLEKRGVQLNSTSLCVGGCGPEENTYHIFFNCPMLSIVWIGSLKWLGVSTAYSERGFDHLKMFKGLLVGEKRAKGASGVIWFVNIFVTRKARNAVVFRQEGFDREKVVEEAKWVTNPLACMGLYEDNEEMISYITRESLKILLQNAVLSVCKLIVKIRDSGAYLWSCFSLVGSSFDQVWIHPVWEHPSLVFFSKDRRVAANLPHKWLYSCLLSVRSVVFARSVKALYNPSPMLGCFRVVVMYVTVFIASVCLYLFILVPLAVEL